MNTYNYYEGISQSLQKGFQFLELSTFATIFDCPSRYDFSPEYKLKCLFTCML